MPSLCDFNWISLIRNFSYLLCNIYKAEFLLKLFAFTIYKKSLSGTDISPWTFSWKQTNKQTNKTQIKPNLLPGKRKIVWLKKVPACLIPHAALLFREWKCFIVETSSCIQAKPDYVRLGCGAVIHVGKHFLSGYNDLSKCPPTRIMSSRFHLPVNIEGELNWASLCTQVYK